jgi:hypothetical protein
MRPIVDNIKLENRARPRRLESQARAAASGRIVAAQGGRVGDVEVFAVGGQSDAVGLDERGVDDCQRAGGGVEAVGGRGQLGGRVG